MGWNPASDVVREWHGAATDAGRVAVAAYYTFCTLAVMVNLASIASLLRMDLYAGCALSSVEAAAAAPAADPAEVLRVAEAYVGLLVRLWQVTIVFLFGTLLLLLLPKERGGGGGKGKGTGSSSLRLHMGIVAASWAAIYLVHASAFRGSRGGPASAPETEDSLHCVRKFWPAFAGAHNAVVLVMVFAKGVDEWLTKTKTKTNTKTKTTPLKGNDK
jgi:hypothetical protein